MPSADEMFKDRCIETIRFVLKSTPPGISVLQALGIFLTDVKDFGGKTDEELIECTNEELSHIFKVAIRGWLEANHDDATHH